MHVLIYTCISALVYTNIYCLLVENRTQPRMLFVKHTPHHMRCWCGDTPYVHWLQQRKRNRRRPHTVGHPRETKPMRRSPQDTGKKSPTLLTPQTSTSCRSTLLYRYCSEPNRFGLISTRGAYSRSHFWGVEGMRFTPRPVIPPGDNNATISGSLLHIKVVAHGFPSK